MTNDTPTDDPAKVINGPLVEKCMTDVLTRIAAAKELEAPEQITVTIQVCASLLGSIAHTYKLDPLEVLAGAGAMMIDDPTDPRPTL